MRGLRKNISLNLEQIINIRTGLTSAISIALHPSFESVESNLNGRTKPLELLGAHLKDGFHHEGKVSKKAGTNLAKTQ